jgi:hypothetical protein
VIKIIAVLCSLSSPANCHEETVTTSDFAEVSIQSCLMGAPQLAEWMKEHPAERLAAWRCVMANGMAGEFRVKTSFPRDFAATPIGAELSMRVIYESALTSTSHATEVASFCWRVPRPHLFLEYLS